MKATWLEDRKIILLPTKTQNFICIAKLAREKIKLSVFQSKSHKGVVRIFDLGGANRNWHAMTSSEIFKSRDFGNKGTVEWIQSKHRVLLSAQPRFCLEERSWTKPNFFRSTYASIGRRRLLSKLGQLERVIDRVWGAEPQLLGNFCNFSRWNSDFNAIWIKFCTFLKPFKRTKKLQKFGSYLKEFRCLAPSAFSSLLTGQVQNRIKRLNF